MKLPAGRSGRDDFDKRLMPSPEQKRKLREVVKKVDLEYGFDHKIYNNFATAPCVEYVCIYGDGRVSPCVGNEIFVGNVNKDSIKEINQRLLESFPCLDTTKFNGH